MTKAFCVCLLLSIGASERGASASEIPALPSVDWGSDPGGPLCGVYAACRIAELFDLDAEPASFISSEFVGSCSGTSGVEMQAMLSTMGGCPSAFRDLSALDIRMIGQPFVANVRADAASMSFDHWIVAIPINGGIKVLDGTQDSRSISMATFLAKWNGVAVYPGFHSHWHFASVWLSRLCVFVIIALSTLLIKRFACRAGGNSVAIIGAWSLALCLPGIFVFADITNLGEGSAFSVTHTMGKTPAKDSLSKIYSDWLEDSGDKPILIDARRPEDFQLGTIPGAVNIPISASSHAIANYMSAIPRSSRMVVFCQSSGCSFDEKVAMKLSSIGFVRVEVAKEGWVEFEATQQDRKRAQLE